MGAPTRVWPIVTSCWDCRRRRFPDSACPSLGRPPYGRWRSTISSSKHTRRLRRCWRSSTGTALARNASSIGHSSLDQSYATLHHWHSLFLLAAEGRFDEAEDEIGWAEQLDPISLPINLGHALVPLLRGHSDDVISQCAKVLNLDSGYYLAHWFRGRALDQIGRLSGRHRRARESAGRRQRRECLPGAHTWRARPRLRPLGQEGSRRGNPRRTGGLVQNELTSTSST